MHGDRLLREQIQGPAVSSKRLAPEYEWSGSHGVLLLSHNGRATGAVYADGRFWLKWREREHRGRAASASQAQRFMMRWLAARGLASQEQGEE